MWLIAQTPLNSQLKPNDSKPNDSKLSDSKLSDSQFSDSKFSGLRRQHKCSQTVDLNQKLPLFKANWFRLAQRPKFHVCLIMCIFDQQHSRRQWLRLVFLF